MSQEHSERYPINRSRRVKTAEELRIEAVVEDVYRSCLRTYQIGAYNISLRIPFGQNGEREGPGGFAQRIYLEGKCSPAEVWSRVDSLIGSEDFGAYVSGITGPGEKVCVFDIRNGRYVVLRDSATISRLKSGPYPGTSVEISVLKLDPHLTGADVYNYLYAIGSAGMDCSGFVYTVQKAIAESFGVNLDERLSPSIGRSVEEVHRYIGIGSLAPGSSVVEVVVDAIENIRPGDVILFRGRNAEFRHSAAIQSIDFDTATIRYLQCTDWAPQGERGVHASEIHFDRSSRGVSLKDASAIWTQELYPAFPGEPVLVHWRTDGDRYRSYMQAGGGVIVRLRYIRNLIEEVQPGFYLNVFNDELSGL